MTHTIALAPFVFGSQTEVILYKTISDGAGNEVWQSVTSVASFKHALDAQKHAAQLLAEYDVPTLDIRCPGQLVSDTPLARLADEARIRRQSKLGTAGAHTCGLCGNAPVVLVPNRVDSVKPLHWILCCQHHADLWPTWAHPLVRHLPFLPVPEHVRDPPHRNDGKTLAELIAEGDDPNEPPPFEI